MAAAPALGKQVAVAVQHQAPSQSNGLGRFPGNNIPYHGAVLFTDTDAAGFLQFPAGGKLLGSCQPFHLHRIQSHRGSPVLIALTANLYKFAFLSVFPFCVFKIRTAFFRSFHPGGFHVVSTVCIFSGLLCIFMHARRILHLPNRVISQCHACTDEKHSKCE